MPETKEQYNARKKAWRDKNPISARNSSLKNTNGITLEYYNMLLSQQQGVCAICGNEETRVDVRTGKTKNLSVDHCHTTGKIRGLLCDKCNNGLGRFRDNPDFLAKAISYLLK